MSITFVGYSRKRQFDETSTMELMSYIPFCDAKSFAGMAGLVPLVQFDGWYATAYTFNDPNHHSDDLFAVFETDEIAETTKVGQQLRATSGADITDAYQTAIGVTFVYGGGASSLRNALADLQRNLLKEVM